MTILNFIILALIHVGLLLLIFNGFRLALGAGDMPAILCRHSGNMVSDTNQTSQAMGFDVDELVIERDLLSEEQIAVAIGALRAEMNEKLMAHLDISTITIFLALPSYIAEAVEARMRDAQKGRGRGSWCVRMQATSGGFQFSFEPPRVDSSFFPYTEGVIAI